MSQNTAGKRSRNSLMHVYLLDAEHALIRDAAAQSGMSVSAWIRAQALISARRLKRAIVRPRALELELVELDAAE
jgi:hypothetical protein